MLRFNFSVLVGYSVLFEFLVEYGSVIRPKKKKMLGSVIHIWQFGSNFCGQHAYIYIYMLDIGIDFNL